jgi:hypothetical protein
MLSVSVGARVLSGVSLGKRSGAATVIGLGEGSCVGVAAGAGVFLPLSETGEGVAEGSAVFSGEEQEHRQNSIRNIKDIVLIVLNI